MKIQSTLKYLGIIAIALGLTVGCAGTGGDTKKAPSISKEASAAISAAKAANKKATASGFEWRDTGKFIKQAEEAAKKGDDAKAIKLAKKAESQAMMAVKQAEMEKSMDRSIK